MPGASAAAITTIVITEIAGRVPPPYPVVSFLVQHIEEVVDELTRRGATFQEPSGAARFAGREGERTGVVTDFGPVRSAFLLDTEGNVLALNELIA